jgi:hypothetical protein
MAEKKILFTINGFEVREDSTYVVKDKVDMDAPSGFIKAGVTKLPSKGVGESFQVRWVKSSNGRNGVWDTGFDEYSPCYSTASKAEAKEMVKAAVENVLKPYRKATGIADAFDKGNEQFFLTTNFSIFSGKVFSTNDPIALAELYFGLLTRQLTPKGQEGNTIYNDSSYIVLDITKDKKVKDERAIDKFEATGAFVGMLKSDRERLLNILDYMGLTFSKSVDDTALIGMFSDFLDTERNGGSKNFLKLVEESHTDTGSDKLHLYRVLKHLTKKGTKVKRVSGILYYDDVEIGPDLKSAAENVAKNSSLASVRNELILAEI